MKVVTGVVNFIEVMPYITSVTFPALKNITKSSTRKISKIAVHYFTLHAEFERRI